MEMRLYTVHTKRRRVEVISDGFSLFALIAPLIWLIWHGAWVTVVVFGAILFMAQEADPFAASVIWTGVALILAFDGAEIRRIELRLWGWEEASVVEARSPEGAEELFLTGARA